MSVKAINTSDNRSKQQNYSTNKILKQQSFTGSFNPVVALMDGIDKGGFAASFIVKDGLGMVAPRIYEGLNRNREKDENGKKIGPLNWEFARREGIREILSGPSAFLIPMGILAILKRTSGTANNVHVDHIEALGQNFAQFASKNTDKLKNPELFKQEYYTKVFEKVLEASTDETFNGNELKETAAKFSNLLVKSEKAKRRGFFKNEEKINNGSKIAKNLHEQITNEYIKIRKLHSAPSDNEFAALLKVEGKEKPFATDIKKLLDSLSDYSDDAMDKTNKYLAKNSKEGIEQFVKEFNIKRAGTRVISNIGMWGAVVAFYALIPKLYNLGLKHDPGLKGLVDEQPADAKKSDIKDNKQDNDNKNVAFTGNFYQKAGETALKESGISKVLKHFEFNGASMSVYGMLTLLFGFCLPTRYANAKSDKERKEILVRDISSFGAILFGAEALSRGFSEIFAKTSGLALTTKPDNPKNSFWKKLGNYFSPVNGINVLSSRQIVSKYSNIDGYKDGINGFFEFLEQNGGNVKKVLNIEKTVKEQSEIIMSKFGSGKSLKDATVDEIKEAFKKAKSSNSEALEKIYSIFSNTDNKFINRAKTLNSAFGFLSTIVLVPVFMMWIARYCENMTKKAVAKEKEEKAKVALQANSEQKIQPEDKAIADKSPAKASEMAIVATNKPTMAGFLNR